MNKQETLEKIEDLRAKKSKLEKQARKIGETLAKLETEAVEKGYGMWVFSRTRKIVPDLSWWKDNYPRSWEKYIEIRSYNKFEPSTK